MYYSVNKHLKFILIFLLLSVGFYWLLQRNNTQKILPNFVYSSPHINHNRIAKLFPESRPMIKNARFSSTIGISSKIDPADTLVERAPSVLRHSLNHLNNSLAVFVFHTNHHVLADLQLFLLRRLTTNLIGLEIFLDGSASDDMRRVAEFHKAGLHSSNSSIHKENAGPSTRNTNVVNWALRTKGKEYLRNGSSILLPDGYVFPLSYFDSITLLNSHDLICRKHPAFLSRYCWIGFICLSANLYNTIDEFDVSEMSRGGRGYDSGGRTIEYLLKYENTSFGWMKETILLETNKDLFWGVMDIDIRWIRSHFNRCDKCGPEIFYSPFNNSNGLFYHMISATSEWRFGDQLSRRHSLHHSILKSPYGFNQTLQLTKKLFFETELISSVQKIQKMPLIPFRGNLTCQNVCKN